MTDGLLNGVRVLDLSDEPMAHGGRLLADLGADVIRVEHPPRRRVAAAPAVCR